MQYCCLYCLRGVAARAGPGAEQLQVRQLLEAGDVGGAEEDAGQGGAGQHGGALPRLAQQLSKRAALRNLHHTVLQ